MIWQPYVDKVRLIRPDDLVRLFHFDERSGASAKDYSPYARTGTYNGPTLQDAIQPCGLNATDFDGINDRVGIFSDLNNDWSVGDRIRCTILMWLEKDWDVSGKKTALEIWTSGDNNIEYYAEYQRLEFYTKIAGNTKVGVCSGLSGTSWHPFVLTWDTDASPATDYIESWCDGISQGKTEGNRGNWSGSLINATIGATGGGSRAWPGHIGITAIWKDVLTDDEIKQISRI